MFVRSLAAINVHATNCTVGVINCAGARAESSEDCFAGDYGRSWRAAVLTLTGIKQSMGLGDRRGLERLLYEVLLP